MSLDDQGFIDLSKLEKKDYSTLLLVRNPFPSTAVPSELPLTTADRQAILRRFTDVLSMLYSDNSSSVTVLLGDYGTGKSHLLKLFKVSVNQKLLTTEKPILAAYVKSPGRSMRDLFLYFIDDLTREFLAELSANWIFKQLSGSDHSKYLIAGKPFKLTNISQFPEYLENVRIFDMVYGLQKALADVGNSDLVKAFLILPHPDYGSIAWRWFVGSSLSRDERETIGIESQIEDTHIAEKIMTALLKLLHILGFVGVVIVADELEALTLIPGMAKGLYQDALRHLIDANPTGLILTFAITPAAWDKLTETPSGLERRLASSVLDLSPFSKEDIHELIQKYLSVSRPKDFDVKVRRR